MTKNHKCYECEQFFRVDKIEDDNSKVKVILQYSEEYVCKECVGIVNQRNEDLLKYVAEKFTDKEEIYTEAFQEGYNKAIIEKDIEFEFEKNKIREERQNMLYGILNILGINLNDFFKCKLCGDLINIPKNIKDIIELANFVEEIEHHIIPRKYNGDNTRENKILLCNNEYRKCHDYVEIKIKILNDTW